ncbi:MAG: polyhydroxyalkanoate synthesis regulator DNA-binding domain-containing protein [Candidatus Eremiobacteraeota bacterium]|nr:polyhydroxyalkanoate synthesis regulator DNA-binding domain-containing protein [Candidatus Eremiobacteraeota bacterium]
MRSGDPYNSTMEPRVVTIKRYTNRRLYNIDESRYVKLDEIAEIIRSGSDIRVIDTQNDEDITKQILAQIILEDEKNKKDLLPASLLYKIIRANEGYTRDFFENYLAMTFDAYETYRSEMEQRLQTVTDISRIPLELGHIFMKSFGMGSHGPARPEKK